ncbi:MAG: hypothetical protein U0169_07835 [Polyangiaceae bacterium]
MTTAHSESFQFYQIGFRCCGDPAGEGSPKAPPAPQGASSGGEGANGLGRPSALGLAGS